MKKSQILVATLCASALVLSACTIGRKPSKKKKSSSQDVPTSVVPGPTSSGTTTSGTPAPTPTSGTSTAPVKVLQSIAVTTAPTTTVYTDGQSFDKTGMVVTATYSDGSTANVTDQCQISPTVLTESTTAVTITFGGQSTTQAVTVNPAIPTSWTAAQLELLNNYLDDQAEAIPFKYVEGAKLFRDPEYVCLTYGEGTDTCSEDFIKEYAALFSSDWNIAIDEDTLEEYESLMYVGEKTFTVGSDEITLSVSLYGMDDNGDITKDGSGHFGMDLSDGFYYGWDEFDPDYLDLLDYFYNGVDEEGYPVQFPEADVVEFEGDVAQIEGVDHTDSTSPYYVAYMYGVTDADFYEFLDAFDASSAWTGTKDNLQGIDCYYHTASESVAVGYNYYPAPHNVGILFFYQYEKSYTSWSEVSPLINDFVDTINPETTTQVPAFESPVYAVEEHADKGYIGVFGLGSDDVTITQENVDKYVQALDPTVWTVEPMEEEEQEVYRDADGNLVTFSTEAEAQTYITEQALENAEVAFYEAGNFYYILVTSTYNYYIASAKDFSMKLQIAYNAYTNSEGGYAAIIVIPLPPLSSEFPASDVVSFFTGKGVAVESLPSYATTSGKFLAESDSTGVKVEIFGSNSEEASAYATLLTSNGWKVDTAASDAEKHLTVLMYGDTLARCQIGDFSAEAGNHEVVIVFDLKTWTEDDLKFFEENLGGIVPPYTDAGIDYDYFESKGQIWSYDTLTADEFAAYVEVALKDGWVEKTQGTTKVYEKVGEKGYAWFYYNGGYIRYIYFQTAWTDDQLAAFATHLGVELPFLEEFSGLEWDDETESFSDYLYPEDCSAAVAAELEGWTASEPEVITEGDAPGTYYTFTKDSSLGGKAVVQLRVYEYSTTYPAVTKIAVYYDDGGDVPPAGEGATLSLTKEMMTDVNNYTSVCTITDGDNVWKTSGGNNNAGNTKWDFLKFGRKSDAQTGENAAYIQTDFVVSGSKITINFKGNGTVDGVNVKNIKLDNIAAIRVYVSDTPFEGLCTDASKLVYTATDLPTGSADLDYEMNLGSFSGYVQIVIEINADGTNNGSVLIKGVVIA